MINLLEELQTTLHAEIPLTRQLGLIAHSYEAGCLCLKAPLAPNINHKATAFAGSLNAVITLSGWGLLWLLLQEEGIAAKIVIQDSSIKYLLPVTGDFVASCRKPDEGQLAKFFKLLKIKRMARLELFSEIYDCNHLAVSFSGRYVAQLI